jgi:hypothetical protein
MLWLLASIQHEIGGTMKSKICMVVVMAVFAFGSAIAVEALRLEWKPKVGQESKYSVTMKAKLDVEGQSMNINLSMNVTEKVVSIQDEKVTLESKTDSLSMTMNEMDLSGMLGSENFDETVVRKLNGEFVSKKADHSMNNPRLEEAFEFAFPQKDISVGDTWSREVKKDEKKGLVNAIATFQLVSKESVGNVECVKLRYSYKELDVNTPMTGEGYIWVALSNGDLVQADYVFQNVILQDGLPPTAMTTSVRRTN